jgi:hypothetical protein
MPRIRKTIEYRLASERACDGLSLKLRRMAISLARKMLKTGKITPLHIDANVPKAISPFLPLL